MKPDWICRNPKCQHGNDDKRDRCIYCNDKRPMPEPATMETQVLPAMSPLAFRECLAHVACMGEQDFIEVFGESSPQKAEWDGFRCYQWNKFAVEYKKDVARWVCYLDGGNLTALCVYIAKHLGRIQYAVKS